MDLSMKLAEEAGIVPELRAVSLKPVTYGHNSH